MMLTLRIFSFEGPAQGSTLSKVLQSTSHSIPPSKEKMRSVSIIALLALVAQAHAEELAQNEDDFQNEELGAIAQDDSHNEDDSMDQFVDMLTDKLADNLFDVGLVGNAEGDEDDQLDEDELGEGEDYAVDEVDDDQLDDDELASVLDLRR